LAHDHWSGLNSASSSVFSFSVQAFWDTFHSYTAFISVMAIGVSRPASSDLLAISFSFVDVSTVHDDVKYCAKHSWDETPRIGNLE